MCNLIGNERWSGHRKFAAAGLREWLVDNERAGLTRGQGKLVYATVEGAGHVVSVTSSFDLDLHRDGVGLTIMCPGVV